MRVCQLLGCSKGSHISFAGVPPGPQPRGHEVILAQWEGSSAGAAGRSTPALQRAGGPLPGHGRRTPPSSPSSCVRFALQTLWEHVALKSRRQHWGPGMGTCGLVPGAWPRVLENPDF